MRHLRRLFYHGCDVLSAVARDLQFEVVAFALPQTYSSDSFCLNEEYAYVSREHQRWFKVLNVAGAITVRRSADVTASFPRGTQ